jgi:hypothetical protein
MTERPSVTSDRAAKSGALVCGIVATPAPRSPPVVPLRPALQATTLVLPATAHKFLQAAE